MRDLAITGFAYSERFKAELIALPPDIVRAAKEDRSWQITFELNGTVAELKRIGTHRQIDRDPR